MNRCMRLVVAASLVFAAPLAVASPAAPPDAGAAIDTAKSSGSEESMLDALEAAGRSGDAKAVSKIVATLDGASMAVRRAAIEALGRIKDPAALDALHAELKRSTTARDSDATYAALIKEIGRHGNPKSIQILADDPFERLTLEAGTARIMGLGRIRTRESLDALLALSRKAGPSARRGRGVIDSEWAGRFREPMRNSAVVLTGKDFGSSRPDWEKWLREEGKKATISPERPPVPADVKAYWERYWEEDYDKSGRSPSNPKARSTPFEIVEKPTADVVKDAVDDLKDAFKTGVKPDVRVAAIQEDGGVSHPDVVYQVARGLSDADRRVQLAAIEALGWSPQPTALKQLHRMFRREKDLHKDEEVFAALLKAIGRHGDDSSIDVLLENPFKGGLDYAAGQARILGLARIRTRESAEELFKAARLGGGESNRRGGVEARPRFREDMRLAYAVLTGEDLGTDKDAWLKWWSDNKSKFKISKQRPPIKPDLQARWQSYWGEPY